MVEHPLKSYRIAHGLSQEDFAGKAQTSASTISRIEARELRPTFELLRRLVGATNGEVSTDALFAAMPEQAGAAAAE